MAVVRDSMVCHACLVTCRYGWVAGGWSREQNDVVTWIGVFFDVFIIIYLASPAVHGIGLYSGTLRSERVKAVYCRSLGYIQAQVHCG